MIKNYSDSEDYDILSDVLLLEVLDESVEQQLKAKLRTYETQYPTEGRGAKRVFVLPHTRLWVAAGVVFLTFLLGSIFLWDSFCSPETSSEILFTENFVPFPNVVHPITRGGGTTQATLKDRAFAAYETEDYTQAALLFERLQTEENTDELKFYLGQSYLATNKVKQAIQVFEQVQSPDKETFWYLGLAYLSNGELEKASEQLREIDNEPRIKDLQQKILILSSEK